MVLDFFKRKKRLSSASLVSCPEAPQGLYRRRGEWGEEEPVNREDQLIQRSGQWGEEEEGGRGDHGRLSSAPEVALDTLKRLRRASTAGKRSSQPGSMASLRRRGEELEQYQSSPVLWPVGGQGGEYSSLQPQSVLRFHRWERHNSLITLDIGGGQPPAPNPWELQPRQGEPVETQEHSFTSYQEEPILTSYQEEPSLSPCQGEPSFSCYQEEPSLSPCQESGEEQEEPGALCYDSDSGISSLYESVGKASSTNSDTLQSDAASDTLQSDATSDTLQSDAASSCDGADTEHYSDYGERVGSGQDFATLQRKRRRSCDGHGGSSDGCQTTDYQRYGVADSSVSSHRDINTCNPGQSGPEDVEEPGVIAVLELLGVCPSLHHVFLQPSPLSCPSVPPFPLLIPSDCPATSLAPVLREILAQKQQLLSLRLLELQLELTDSDENLSYLEGRLEDRLLRPFLVRLDSAVSLQVGLLLRLQGREESISLDTLRDQLAEASLLRRSLEQARRRCEEAVARSCPGQVASLQSLLASRETTLDTMARVKRESFIAQLQAKVLAI